jgi:hypothetical protein
LQSIDEFFDEVLILPSMASIAWELLDEISIFKLDLGFFTGGSIDQKVRRNA